VVFRLLTTTTLPRISFHLLSVEKVKATGTSPVLGIMVVQFIHISHHSPHNVSPSTSLTD